MMLYHGTPGINGEQIIKSKTINNDCKRQWSGDIHLSDGTIRNIDTTNGFVYLTNKLSLAVFYGNANRVKLEVDCNEYYVFRVTIPDSMLLPDLDELKMNWQTEEVNSFEESLKICCCVAVDFPISADQFEVEYIKVNARDYSSKITMEIFEFCKEYRTIMSPDPKEELARINSMVEWIKL